MNAAELKRRWNEARDAGYKAQRTGVLLWDVCPYHNQNQRDGWHVGWALAEHHRRIGYWRPAQGGEGE